MLFDCLEIPVFNKNVKCGDQQLLITDILLVLMIISVTFVTSIQENGLPQRSSQPKEQATAEL